MTVEITRLDQDANALRTRNQHAGKSESLRRPDAGWHHKRGCLVMPNNIGLLHLPPYSPGLNPTENIWEFLQQNDPSNPIYASYEATVDACCIA